jgi:hypothetical protein
MLTGEGLDPWGFMTGLRRLTLVGRVLRANRAAGPPDFGPGTGQRRRPDADLRGA